MQLDILFIIRVQTDYYAKSDATWTGEAETTTGGGNLKVINQTFALQTLFNFRGLSVFFCALEWSPPTIRILQFFSIHTLRSPT